MLKSRLEKFLAGRLIVLFTVLSAVDIIFIEKRWIVLAGLTVGAALSLLRLGSMVRMIEHFTLPQESKSTASSKPWYAVQIVVTLAVLLFSGLYSLWLFAGVTVSEFIIPIIIMFYGITDAIGITKNRLTEFEDKSPPSLQG